jgi:peroxiredoxin
MPRSPYFPKLFPVLVVGDPIPDVRLWTSPQERVSLRELAAERPLLLLFYLFDWSST